MQERAPRDRVRQETDGAPVGISVPRGTNLFTFSED